MGSNTMTPCRESPIHRGPGYGGHRNQKFLHRWVVETAGEDQFGTPWDESLVVMHLCDNRLCFRFDHLKLGTASDNQRDSHEKGRARNGRERDHCVHGHPYDEDNTYYRKDRPGHRECRACRKEADHRR